MLYKRREYAEAMLTLRKVADRSPKAPELRYHLAMAQLKSRARAATRTSLEQPLKCGGTFPESGEAQKTFDELGN